MDKDAFLKIIRQYAYEPFGHLITAPPHCEEYIAVAIDRLATHLTNLNLIKAADHPSLPQLEAMIFRAAEGFMSGNLSIEVLPGYSRPGYEGYGVERTPMSIKIVKTKE